jgi:p-hydroxybenzoate 3-monooxygenase
MTRTTVAVVGAGPAGLLLGNLLLDAGVDCLLVERSTRDQIENDARAGVIEQRTVELLDRHGLAKRLRARAQRRSLCEFRCPDGDFLIDCEELVGGCHYVYPQNLLVRDLAEAYLAKGGQVRYGTDVTKITGLGRRPSLTVSHGGSIKCAYLAGCDGSRGTTRRIIPAMHQPAEHHWLALKLAMPAAIPHVTYAVHPSGFAGQMPRSAMATRFYLQIEPGETALWDEARIKTALADRLRIEVPDQPLISCEPVDLRVRIAKHADHGRLFLAGDAAHLIPPAGGKGMSLALGDAADLAAAFTDRICHRRREQLAAYSDGCLSRAWQAAEFSLGLLDLLNATARDPFRSQVRRARLAMLHDNRETAVAFARRYIGAA